jgi:PKD repeat protein
LQFVGVPAGTYNLVCYAGNGVVNNGANNLGSTFVVHDSVNGNQTNSTAEPTHVTDALSEGVNFVTFTNVHIAGGVLNVDVLGNVDTGGSAIIQGAQLQLVSYDPLVAGFSGTPTNIFMTQSVVFRNTSTTASFTNSAWSFGDGNVANNSGANATNNVTNTYNIAGTYTVSLIVNGGGGSSTNTRANYIVVKPKPVIGNTVLSGGSVILSGTDGAAGQQYRILTSTNVVLPLANWTPVWTNVFAADGSYSYTNSSPTNNSRFFLLVSP